MLDNNVLDNNGSIYGDLEMHIHAYLCIYLPFCVYLQIRAFLDFLYIGILHILTASLLNFCLFFGFYRYVVKIFGKTKNFFKKP